MFYIIGCIQNLPFLARRMLDVLSRVLHLGLRDASADVRKASRLLFWVLKSMTVYEENMEKLLGNLDSATRKRISEELQLASEDFIELLNDPTGGLDDPTLDCTYATPFEGKQSPFTVVESKGLSSSLERPMSDQTAKNSKSFHPPPLPVSSSQSQPSLSRQYSGPSRVLQSAPQRQFVQHNSTDSSAHLHDKHGTRNTDVVTTSYGDEKSDKLVKRSVVGARRTSMVPERVAKNNHVNSDDSKSSQEDIMSSAQRDIPPPAPPALSISNSLRTKR